MKLFDRLKRAATLSTIFAVLLGFGVSGAYAQPFALGDVPLDPAVYDSYLMPWPDEFTEALPASYDARSEGLVTPAKDQGSCGSCWAFASIGAIESHLIKECDGAASDLSEQQAVSCNTQMSGCCGGSSTSLRYWETRGPITESCGPYGEGAASCPTQSTVPCSSMDACSQLENRVTGYHTVPVDPLQMKTSLYNDGPSYWRFDVYADFYPFWSEGAPGSVYVHEEGDKQGGHAVLLIGWDDSKQAYLCKNSWGAAGGPQGDGTFWIAYGGHARNLGFQMANFDLTCGWETAYATLLSDPDDLLLLRELREDVLKAHPDGKLISEVLYRHSEAALAVLTNEPGLMAEARRLIQEHRYAVQAVIAGEVGVVSESEEVIALIRQFGREAPPMLRLLAATVTKQMLEKREAGETFFGFYLD